VPFYECLREQLARDGIDLKVVYGQPAKNEVEPHADLAWGTRVHATYVHFGKRMVVWLPALRHVRRADLVVVQQSNQNVFCWLLACFKRVFGFRLAFWGHGKSLQASNPNSLGERLKRIYSTKADHWFAYTDLSKAIIQRLGFPVERITSVGNAIDTRQDTQWYRDIPEDEIDELRRRFSLRTDTPVGIYCSRLYHGKGLDVLLHCVSQVRRKVSGFQFIVIGGGAAAPAVRKYAMSHSDWFRYVGPQYGREKVKYFRLAQFQFMPDMVGLHVVDSFALETPLVTMNTGRHGPEIVYLINGVNGIMTENDLEVCVRAMVGLIRDPACRERLVNGCRASREIYTIENMAERFAEGIRKALAT
jgi:glycosyltransferase involved in cell wall biosynthesis